MTDYQVAVPVVICLGGFFFFAVACLFAYLREHATMVFFWLGMSGVMIMDGLFAGFILARDTLTADLTTAASVGYIVAIGTFMFSLIYFIWYLLKEGLGMLSGWRPLK